MINMIYAALSMRAQTEKTTLSCKEDCTLTKNTRRCTYSARDFEIPLCHTPPLRSFFGMSCILATCTYFHIKCNAKIYFYLLSAEIIFDLKDLLHNILIWINIVMNHCGGQGPEIHQTC